LSNEPAWQEIDALPVIMYQPTFDGMPSEKTEIRIAYDKDYFYASARFYDSDPTGIRINSLYRDRNNGDDTFNILIDTFNDKENALLFWTNPAGMRGDGAISGDGRSFNVSWNTYWDVSTVQNEEGWFAEIRIPFSSLGFQKQSDLVKAGLIAFRYIGRKDEIILFPKIESEWNFTTPSQAQEVILEGIISQKPIYGTPYLLGGFGQTPLFDEAVYGYNLESTYTSDLGLDIKYNFKNNLTADITINTDFSQVEADDQQVNLTRFSLFFPEKRQFFQERSGIFSFNTVAWGNDRLFHSRRIGLHEGKEVRILGGARLVGRMGSWDIGIIDIQTEKSENLPSENFGIIRLRRQVFNPYSYAGGIFISRVDTDGSFNLTCGLDGIFRLFGNEYLVLKWAQTYDKTSAQQISFSLPESSSFQALWQRRSREGLSYLLSVSRAGEDYNPKMGFRTRRDFTEYSWRISYDWLKGEESPFRQVSPIQFFGFAALRNSDGSVESAQFEYDTDFFWKSGASIWADVELYYEDFKEALSFPDNTEIPAGSYTFYKVEGGYNMAPGHLLRANFQAGLGTFYDGWQGEFSLWTNWNISRHLSISPQYNLNIVRFPEREQGFNAHIFRARFSAALNTKLSLNGFIQYNNIDDVFTSNVRLRLNFREGSDLWIVYNEGLNMDRERFIPILPKVNNRTILVKYTYTFQF
jgi:hypothetical protein